MAVVNNPKSGKVSITLNAGLNADGTAKTKTISYGNISEAAADQAVYETVSALVALQSSDVKEVVRQKNGTLINQ